MHLVSCLNPNKIKNPYTGELMYVPCRHCSACQQIHQSQWTKRIKLESYCWKFSYFFTLTYNNESLPRMKYDGNTFQFLDTSRCNPELGGFVYYAKDMYFTDYDKTCLDYDTRKLGGNIPFLNPYDVQLFLKRLRKYVYKNFKEKIRCIYVGEYGKQHRRPHYHGIIWTNNVTLADQLPKIIAICWKYGFVNSSQSEGKCSEYVAKYIGKSQIVPVYLRQKRTTPFSISSKNPPLGSLVIPNDEILRIFHEASPELRVFNPVSNVFEATPLWNYIQARLFPLISRYELLSHAMRLRLYGISERFVDFHDFEKSFYNGVLSYTVDKYIMEVTECLQKPSAIYRLFSISSQVCRQAQVFGVSLNYYVEQIEKFYANKKSYNIKEWYDYQMEFSEQNNINGLVGSDLIRFDHICDTEECMLSNSDIEFLKGMNVDLEMFFSSDIDKRTRYRQFLHPFASPDYHQLAINAECFIRQRDRVKDKNEYNGLIL